MKFSAEMSFMITLKLQEANRASQSDPNEFFQINFVKIFCLLNLFNVGVIIYKV